MKKEFDDDYAPIDEEMIFQSRVTAPTYHLGDCGEMEFRLSIYWLAAILMVALMGCGERPQPQFAGDDLASSIKATPTPVETALPTPTLEPTPYPTLEPTPPEIMQPTPLEPTPGAVEDAMIVPGERIGKLRFGMSEQEMIRALGKPDRYEAADVFVYIKSGMTVMGSGQSPAIVTAVCFGDSSRGDSPLTKYCKFRTDRGIGMDSTMEDLLRAYGEPSLVRQELVGQEVSYRQLGASFTLVNNKVVHMWFENPRYRMEYGE